MSEMPGAPVRSDSDCQKGWPRARTDDLQWRRAGMAGILSPVSREYAQVHQLSEGENILRLQRALKGPAREPVEALLLCAKNVEEVVRLLKRRFGDENLFIANLVEKARRTPVIRDDKLETLLTFSSAVSNLNGMLRVMDGDTARAYAFNPILVQEFVSKMSFSVKRDWGLFRARKGGLCSIGELAEWLELQADGVRCLQLPGNEKVAPRREEKLFKMHTQVSRDDRDAEDKPQEFTRMMGCSYCDASHPIWRCADFKKLSTPERREVVNKKRLCFSCLNPGHKLRSCPRKRPCGIKKCLRNHSYLLHLEPEHTGVPDVNHKAEFQGFKRSPTPTSSVLFQIIPIRIFGPKGYRREFAFLDSGSEVSVINKGLAQELGIDGVCQPLCLQYSDSTVIQEKNSRSITVLIQGDCEAAERFELRKVRTMTKLTLPEQTLNFDKLKEIYPHLDGTPGVSYERARPRLLIGQDHAHLLCSLEVRESEDGPIATRTKLGWAIHGGTQRFKRNPASSSPIMLNIRLCNCGTQAEEEIQAMVSRTFKLEDFGAKELKRMPENPENVRAKQVFEATTSLVDGRFETGLIWRTDDITIPSNRNDALRRLSCVEKRMDKDDKFNNEYCEQIDKYIQKGYAKKLTQEEVNKRTSRTSYLPHFGVINSNKKKIRVVFDARSLNEALLQGPDLYTSLTGMLLRFREGRFAVCADIQEMFLRIRIIEQDQDSQRFLYRGSDRKNDPDEYVMVSMTFGAASSPYSAQAVKNLLAEKHREEYPEAATELLQNFYMDDYLGSFDQSDHCRLRVQEIKTILKSGNFNLIGFIASPPELLNQLEGIDPIADLKNLGIQDETSAERVLGMSWKTSSDEFLFTLKFHKIDQELLQNKRVPTKREILSVVMSVFDPLGLIAHFTIYGRIIMQKTWICGIDWSEQIPDPLYEEWKRWMKEFERVKGLRVARCYDINIPHAITIEIHVFCDASDQAFSSVAYLRVESQEGTSVTLVAAKARVAPTKPVTIPRLELMAAVMGTRLAEMIQKEQRIHINHIYYWSDSKIVLNWIRSEPRKFKPFVAFKIGEIIERTSIKDWRYIPTKLNVADDATKWTSTPSFDPHSRWFSGPEFLRLEEKQWPQEEHDQYGSFREDVSEMRHRFVGNARVPRRYNELKACKYSTWWKLLRATAMLMRIRDNYWNHQLKLAAQRGFFKIEELSRAERIIFRKIQWESYPEQIITLERGKTISVSSSLYKLQPYLDENGILRMKGRLQAAPNFLESMKHPIILDPRHWATRLMLHDVHEQCFHRGQGTMMIKITARFWVPSIKVALRRVKNECQRCRIDDAMPKPPEMGQLPAARITPYVRPFTFTGVDCFGPVSIVSGRRHEKRWGVLFTCLTIRAIHLELVSSLSSDSFILALRRFMARRGTPHSMVSDNATNFKGASQELKEAVKNLDQEIIGGKCARLGIKWTFIPPAAPHQGGCWERMIRTVKELLTSIISEKILKEEALRTYLVEVEGLINARPLLDWPVDPDSELLTPNHFLIGENNASESPGEFTSEDWDSRKQWRMVQAMVDTFWKRWIGNYLPRLNRRTKWLESAPLLEIDQLVLIVDDQAKRNQWLRGRIVKVYPGPDGQIRSADVKTANGVVKRSAQKIAVIDVSPVNAREAALS